MYQFRRASLAAELSVLPTPLAAVFAALCARRLAQAYLTSGDRAESTIASALGDLHARLWHALTVTPLPTADAEAAEAASLALLPTAEDGGEPLVDEAVAALTYALRAVHGGAVQHAVWAAECAYNAAG